jgi:hypothetical protein
MAFDAKCYELAVDFLDDAPGRVTEKIRERLAQTIQDAIEEFLQDADNFPPPEPMFDSGRDRDEWKHEAAEWKRLK